MLGAAILLLDEAEVIILLSLGEVKDVSRCCFYSSACAKDVSYILLLESD